jgi:Protein of unknown function (DUF1579)
MTTRLRFARFVCTASFAALALLALPLAAQQGDEKTMGDHEGMAQEQHQTSPEEAAMMQAWHEAMTPGPQHAQLAKGAGDFKVTVKTWMDPSAPPQVTTGTSHREMTMGGRFLVEHVKGEMMGMPFEGSGTTGYDNAKGTYWSTWNDSMGTGVELSEGSAGADGKVTFIGSYFDPMTHQDQTNKSVIWWEGDDTQKMEMLGKHGDDWVKMMELTFERVK